MSNIMSLDTLLFDRCSVGVPGGRTTPAYKIVCGKCGAQDKATNNGARRLAVDNIAQIFRNRGWTVGGRSGRHLCPACAKRSSSPKPKSQMEAIMPSNVSAVPPREMSRADGRLIFDKINDVYLDDGEGYSDGWSDARIAKDLGVPVAWITDVRDRHFGDAIGVEAKRRVLSKGESILKSFDDLLQQLAARRAEFAREVDALAKKLGP